MSETAERARRPRRRARGRPPLGLDADHGALVAAGRRARRSGRSSACSSRSASGDVYRAETLLYLGQPFTPSGGGQIQSLRRTRRRSSEIIRSEAATEDGGGRARACTSASCAGTSRRQAVVHGRARSHATSRRSSRSRSRAPTRVKAEKAANSLAQHRDHAGRADLRRPEDRAPEAADRRTSEQPSSRTSTPAIDARVEQQQAAIADTSLSLDREADRDRRTSTTRSTSPSSAAAPCSRSCTSASSCSRSPRTSSSAGSCSRPSAAGRPRRAAATPPRSARLLGLLLGALAAIDRRSVPAAKERAERGVARRRWSRASASPSSFPPSRRSMLVAETLRGIPDFVDRIYVVDDASADATAAAARAVGDPRRRGDRPRARTAASARRS